MTSPDTFSDAARRAGTGLLGIRRFRPLFLTHFLGAVNANLFRHALVGVLAFQVFSADAAGFGTATWINIAAGLFVLPFFLCSAIAGQFADKLDKSDLIRRIKLAEVFIMLLSGFAVVRGSLPLLLLSIALMGAQSAFFGPARYGILPLQLSSDELTGGNALVQAGTMVAILCGTIAGGLLVAVPVGGSMLVAAAIFLLALLGWLASRSIPPAPPRASSVEIDYNVLRSTWHVLRSVTSSRTILLSVLGISWFWFIGSVLLAQLPFFVRDVLDAGQGVATLLLATLTLGVAAGTLLCEKFSGRRIEIGLVPVGALGITVFAASFALTDFSADWARGPTAGALLASGGGIALIGKLFLLALSAGLYIVPLYAVTQARSDPAEVSRVMALSNVVNAIFMVLAALGAFAMLQNGASIQQLILVVTAVHVAVVVFIFFEVPEFAMRLFVWVVTHSIYRVSADGLENIPDRGPAILVSNHVSLIDPLIITAKCRRPIRFVMYYKIYRIPFVSFLFRASGAIPIASHREDPELLARAYEEIAVTLERGGLVGLFPEGQLTTDGEVGEFRTGIERILDRSPVPVVPMALSGLWGTFFTRFNGRPLMSRWPTHWLARVRLNVGRPVDPSVVAASTLHDAVRSLILPV